MTPTEPVEIRLFGSLHAFCTENDLPTLRTHVVPADGIPARDLAAELELPLSEIEGVFANGHVFGPDHVIMPGDRVAFVPRGTPGPHRFFLGLFDAGKSGSWEE
ncbi:MAG: MoaD/ThiS family protein [Coriobacteriia bacterium]